MSFLAAYWWIFLVTGVVFAALAFRNQLARMKNFMNSGTKMLDGNGFDNFGDSFFKPFFAGVGTMIVYCLLTGVSFILLLIGVIANFMGR